jgi:curved DNA-binding protein CbpA
VTPRADPYRVLGLVPGASAGEIRSAYRRLAKIYHPDKAGDRSLPRFLAIQAAYEALVDGEGNLRARGWPTKGAPSARPANPNARGASRDAWRARRASGAGSAASTGPKADRAKAGADGAKPGDDSGAKAGAKRAGADGSKRAGGGRHAAERRTAKPGSTTYDEATQPLDPSWDGAGWYGASSGRYWTLNPKEYADPRKHGPEYQERAKRAAKLEAQLRSRRAGEARGAGSASSGPSSSAPGGPPPPPDFIGNARPASAASSAPAGGPKSTTRRSVRRPDRPAAT